MMSPSDAEIKAAAKAIREVLNMPSVSHSARTLAIAALEAAARVREIPIVGQAELGAWRLPVDLAAARKGKG